MLKIGAEAARIRIRYHLRLPDAIQIATAIHTGSSALITHDRNFSGVDEIKILGIDEEKQESAR